MAYYDYKDLDYYDLKILLDYVIDVVEEKLDRCNKEKELGEDLIRNKGLAKKYGKILYLLNVYKSCFRDNEYFSKDNKETLKYRIEEANRAKSISNRLRSYKNFLYIPSTHLKTGRYPYEKEIFVNDYVKVLDAVDKMNIKSIGIYKRALNELRLKNFNSKKEDKIKDHIKKTTLNDKKSTLIKPSNKIKNSKNEELASSLSILSYDTVSSTIEEEILDNYKNSLKYIDLIINGKYLSVESDKQNMKNLERYVSEVLRDYLFNYQINYKLYFDNKIRIDLVLSGYRKACKKYEKYIKKSKSKLFGKFSDNTSNESLKTYDYDSLINTVNSAVKNIIVEKSCHTLSGKLFGENEQNKLSFLTQFMSAEDVANLYKEIKYKRSMYINTKELNGLFDNILIIIFKRLKSEKRIKENEELTYDVARTICDEFFGPGRYEEEISKYKTRNQ